MPSSAPDLGGCGGEGEDLDQGVQHHHDPVPPQPHAPHLRAPLLLTSPLSLFFWCPLTYTYTLLSSKTSRQLCMSHFLSRLDHSHIPTFTQPSLPASLLHSPCLLPASPHSPCLPPSSVFLPLSLLILPASLPPPSPPSPSNL